MTARIAARLLAVVLGAACLLSSSSAFAMSLEKVSWKGREVLRLTGPIQAGDAQTFAAALDAARPAAHGRPIVLLDSPGGAVGEAMKISRLLDARPVHMIIPAGGRCASACASILFIAGDLRTIEEGGLLGQHSCASNGVPNEQCNELLAEHAVDHGVAHGAVAAYTTQVPPDEIVWLNRATADCWGITRYPFERESGFARSDDCIMKVLKGAYPPAQSAWRLEPLGSGWRAFVRPVNDHEREMELSIHCDERRPGRLFFSMEIGGPAEVVSKVVTSAMLSAPGSFDNLDLPFSVEQVDPLFTRVTATVPGERVLPLLTEVGAIAYGLGLEEPYEPMVATTWLANSRKALIFAANHCENR
jgi:hypothetical protein